MAAFWVYLLGTASLMLSDVLVTARFSSNEIVLWADFRALFGILATIVTLGLEMVIVRTPTASRLLLQLVGVQAVVIGIPLGFAANSLGYLSSPWNAVLLATGAAFSLTQGQYFRSHNHFLLSQITQQGWRFAIVLLLGLTVLFQGKVTSPLDTLAAITIFAVSILGWLAVIIWPPERDEAIPSLGKHYKISARFLVTNIVLSLALFGEQMIVNGIGTAQQAALYFTHITYFLLPISTVTAYVGFRLGPWLRDNPDYFATLLSKYRIKVHLCIYVGVATFHILGWIGWQIAAPAVGKPDYVLLVMFYVSSVARTFYVISSAYNGIFGQLQQHDILIFSQVVLLIAIVLAVYALGGAANIVYLVAVAGAFNWTSRTVLADFVMKRIMKLQYESQKRGAAQ